MKRSIFLFLLGIILFVCQTKAYTINDVSAIETEMINFFRSTLQRNYGSSDGKAVKLMMDALLHYKFHYIIDVDKEALKAINDKLYPDMFGSYFVETKEHPIDSLHTNWKRYDPYHIICGYEFKKQLNGETYYQKELSQATSPLFKEICNAYEATGSLPFTVVLGKFRANNHQCLDAFETDRDVQMLFAFFFWRYLCYCVNIDFMTGKDKTKLYIDMRR